MIRIYPPSELQSHQVGYSVKPNGESLTCGRDGDWLTNWLVIGCAELTGDPIFINTAVSEFPVFTAMHGEGRWNPRRIAASLEGFGKALSIVAALSKDREFPVALDKNPLPECERKSALDAIQNANPGIELEFWEILLG